jgi:TP901 family phage tail tape measure protein
MSHSFGSTGFAYASGIRATPGGSAFTLTGVFIDRITPRLLKVAATAKGVTGAINATGPSLQMQALHLKNLSVGLQNAAVKYRALGNSVKYYEGQLAAAQVRAEKRWPTRNRAGRYVKGHRVSAQRQAAYLLPFQADVAAHKEQLLLQAAYMKQLSTEFALEHKITSENLKQLSLKKMMLAQVGGGRTGGELAMAGIGRGVRYGALAGGIGLAAAGLSLLPIAAMQMEYTKAAAQVRAIGQLSINEMSRLSEFVLNKTRELAINAEQSMGGMLTLVRAGIRATSELQQLADPAMKLSVVNAIELDEVMRSLLVTQNAFNLERDTGNEIAANQQILINRSLMDFSDYVDGMKYAIAWSNKLGLTYQQTAAAIATMTDAGIRAGIGGRGMRRMFSKFADDLEIIEQRLRRGGSSLSVFSQDGVLNLSEMLHSLGDTGDTVDDLTFALDTFGLRGSTAFLTLAQNADEYDAHVKAQTGDINVLNDAVAVAQDSMAAQWQLLKNELKAIMLDEKLVTPMKELVEHIRSSGGLQDLTEMLADLIRMFIRFWKDGGWEMLMNSAKSLLKIFSALMPLFLVLGRILMWVAANERRIFTALFLSRLMKAGTLMNSLAVATAQYVALQRIAAGQSFGRLGGIIGSRFAGAELIAFANMGGMRGPGAAGTAAGLGNVLPGSRPLAKAGLMRRIGGGLMGGSALGGLVPLAVIGALVGGYMMYQSNMNKRGDYWGGVGQNVGANQIHINGDIYGFDNFDQAVQDSNRYSSESGRRYW